MNNDTELEQFKESFDKISLRGHQTVSGPINRLMARAALGLIRLGINLLPKENITNSTEEDKKSGPLGAQISSTEKSIKRWDAFIKYTVGASIIGLPLSIPISLAYVVVKATVGNEHWWDEDRVWLGLVTQGFAHVPLAHIANAMGNKAEAKLKRLKEESVLQRRAGLRAVPPPQELTR